MVLQLCSKKKEKEQSEFDVAWIEIICQALKEDYFYHPQNDRLR